MPDDRPIIEDTAVRVGVDMTGFRRELERKLKVATAGVVAKVHAEAAGGGAAGARVAARQAAAKDAKYLVGLQVKNINTVLKRVRTADERIEADRQAAAAKSLDRDLRNLGTRFKMQQAGEKATRDSEEKTAKAKQDASDKYFVNLGKQFDQQRKGAAATKRAIADQAAEEKRAAAEAQSAAVKRQRADEQYASFHRQVAGELDKMDRAREDDSVSYAAERQRQVAAIDQAGLTLRRKILQVGEAADRDSIRKTEEAEKASQRRRAASRAGASKMFKTPKLVDYGGKGVKPMNLLLGIALALTPALVAVASSALQASTAVAALGAAGIGAGLALGGLIIGFSHLGDVMALHEQVRKEGIKTTANAAAAEQKAARKSAVDSEAAIARQDRIVDAVESLQDARRSVIRAQRDEADAQKALNDSRKEAAQDIRDLREQVRQLALDERDAALNVDEAKAKKAEVDSNYWATALERRRAALDVAEAENKVVATHNERLKKSRELSDLERKGVERSDKVLQARRDAADARERVADSKRGAQHAAREVSRARRPVPDSEVAAAGGGIAATSSAAAQLADELKNMGPGLKGLYTEITDNEDAFKGLRKGIENAVLPGFTHFLDEVTQKSGKSASTLEVFAAAAGELGGIVSKYVGKLGEMSRTPWFRGKFAAIQKENAYAFDLLGEAALTMVKPLTQIVAAAAPLFGTFSGGLLKLAQRFAAFIDTAERTGALKKWFADARVEFGKWVDIGRNVLTVLGAIFGASLPSGQGLVTQFRDFTKRIADWSTSPHGKKSIEDFFEKFKNLPYGKIRDLFVQATALFLASRAVKAVGGGPLNLIFTALAILAAKNPERTAQLLEKTTDFILDTLGYVEKHPKTAATVLALLAAMKIAKGSAEIGIKLPGLAGLASKFKPLEKLLGGMTSTGVMTVHAGIVNVLGGAGVPGAGGLPGAAAAGAAAKGGLGNLGPGAAFVAPFAVEMPFAAPADKPAKQVEDEVAKYGSHGSWESVWRHAMRQPKNAPKGGAPNGPGNNPYGGRGSKVIAEEAAAFNVLNDKIKQHATALRQNNVVEAEGNTYLRDYIAARRTSVTEVANAIRMTRGNAAAEQFLQRENVKSRATLVSMMIQMGASTKFAQDYANKIFGIPNVKKTAVSTPGADESRIKLEKINTQLKQLSKDHKANVSVTGYKDVTTQLIGLLAMQESLRLGITPAQGRQNVITSALNADRNSPVRKARGGPVWGQGTTTSDSIPAMLSNREFVQPAKATDHYGLAAMEAIRQRRVPKEALGMYAAGGLAVKMPFPVDASKTQIPQPLVDMGGHVVGDVDVARIAENTARAMKATDKQLLALIEAGIVESEMRNLAGGDRDSVGFLQQRASWGPRAERMNVAVATAKFIRKAKRRDHKGQTAGELAQAVQISGRPLRYDQREADAYAVINRELPGIVGAMGGLPGAFTGKVPKGLGRVGGINKQMLAAAIAIHGQFPRVTVTSGYRPGSITVTGNHSYHGKRRAIDLAPPSMPLFESIRNRYGRVAQEIIYSPANGRQIWHGKNHMYSGAVRRIHYDHVHLALAKGGPVRAFDTGGKLPPGVHTVYNGTGHDETVRTKEQEAALGRGAVRLDKRDIVLLAQHIAAASAQPVHMDGRKVAEIVRGYDYLPAGV